MNHFSKDEEEAFLYSIICDNDGDGDNDGYGKNLSRIAPINGLSPFENSRKVIADPQTFKNDIRDAKKESVCSTSTDSTSNDGMKWQNYDPVEFENTWKKNKLMSLMDNLKKTAVVGDWPVYDPKSFESTWKKNREALINKISSSQNRLPKHYPNSLESMQKLKQNEKEMKEYLKHYKKTAYFVNRREVCYCIETDVIRTMLMCKLAYGTNRGYCRYSFLIKDVGDKVSTHSNSIKAFIYYTIFVINNGLKYNKDHFFSFLAKEPETVFVNISFFDKFMYIEARGGYCGIIEDVVVNCLCDSLGFKIIRRETYATKTNSFGMKLICPIIIKLLECDGKIRSSVDEVNRAIDLFARDEPPIVPRAASIMEALRAAICDCVNYNCIRRWSLNRCAIGKGVEGLYWITLYFNCLIDMDYAKKKCVYYYNKVGKAAVFKLM